MKVHYINIFLFSLPLNILVYNHRNHKITTSHTQTNRSLCECELYAPANYDNDPQMKEVMQQFEDRTSQRFHEYDERMKTTRQKCKDKCDKEIQKIILKDKLEKEMAEQLTTLETKINIDDIPTCVCEKSLAEKVEKGCLRCGGVLGGGVAPGWGLVSGLGYAAWSHYVPIAVTKAANDAGISTAIDLMGNIFELSKVSAINLTQLITPENFSHKMSLVNIVNKVSNMCGSEGVAGDTSFCLAAENITPSSLFTRIISRQAGDAAEAAGNAAKATEIAEAAKFVPKTTILSNTIIASVIAIVVIVLIMVIIYLILRYRRKKKMKKKLQYIKLLEE
ncbi:rifin [Plasmodium reichenowi]|uniref:Rifin n=1 Tax=Plasmodium reichenowi TaxID=5854 RepID=A0A060RM88_PLARE|nr:rifin [Plasmodium reichenowi]